MKKLILAFLVIFSISACNETEKETSKPIDESKSVYYKEVIKTLHGDIAGLSIGASVADCKKIIDGNYLAEEADDYLMYLISDNKYTVAEYGLIFEDGKLVEIALDIDVYNEEDSYDAEGASKLFEELKEDFLERFGSKYLETVTEENTVLFWSDDVKEIQLIKDAGKVHVYIDVISEDLI